MICEENMSKIVLYESEMECCGCSACKCICPKQAISMVENSEGFLYPQIDDTRCIECGMCQKVCPVGNFEKPYLENEDKDKIQIGILSLSTTMNFGAKLVTYALQKKIEELIPNSIVNIINFAADTNQDSFVAFAIKRIKEQGVIKPLMHLLDSKKNQKLHKKEFSIRAQKYHEFDIQYLNIKLSTKKISDFKQYVNSLDAIVVGSDIVFRPEFAQLYPMVYFLGCISNQEVRKVSYAASIGTNNSETLNPLSENYKNGLANYDYISTREKASQEFLQKLTEKKVELCCDPVMLCDLNTFDFENDFEVPKKKYIFMYILDKNSRAVKYAKKLAKEKDMDIYYFSESNLDDKNMFNVFSEGPAEFVQIIKNADYVITNSFHCIVFSIMFKKPFVAFMRTRQSLKITNVLEYYGLQSRAVFGKTKFNIDEQINWEDVHKKWDNIRNSSIKYLSDSLSNLE